MKRILVAALLAGAALAHAQSPASAPASAPSAAKKALVQKLLTLQQPGIEQMARGLVERPAAQMLQEASRVVQEQVPEDKREAVGKSIQADAKKYVEESTPLVRERAIKLAPSTIGSILEEKLTEDELKQVIAWFESPVNKKYQSIAQEMQESFVQRLVVDARPLVEPKLKALNEKVRATLVAAVNNGATSPAPAPAPPKAAKPAASAAPAAKSASK